VQIDYADDEQWNMWVKAGVWKLLSSNGKPTCITENSSNMFAAVSPHQSVYIRDTVLQNPVASIVTPLQTLCDMQNDTLLDHHSGEDYLSAMDWDLNLEQLEPLEPMMATNIQVSKQQNVPGVC
jgi:hypothetical protein